MGIVIWAGISGSLQSARHVSRPFFLLASVWEEVRNPAVTWASQIHLEIKTIPDVS